MVGDVRFTVETRVQVYLCDSECPWQRGSAGNTNHLVRPYLPWDARLLPPSQEELDKIAVELSERCRETLYWKRPQERFSEFAATTG